VNAQNADAELKGEIERVREVSERDYAQRLHISRRHAAIGDGVGVGVIVRVGVSRYGGYLGYMAITACSCSDSCPSSGQHYYSHHRDYCASAHRVALV
jgi:hypothetical protein